MKGLFWCVLSLFILMLAACGGNRTTDKAEETKDSVPDTVNTVPEWTEADSTIYGVADGFGQGGFTLIAEDGRELELALTSENGERYGVIYGERSDTARYAVTTREDGESLGVMINLSQLERFTKDYDIYNCHLILKDGANRDWVEIEELSDTLFKAQGKSGKAYLLRR